MKRKVISILVAGMVMASFAGCGTQAETANSAVPGQGSNETVVSGEESATDKEESASGGQADIDYGSIVIYDNKSGDSKEVDMSSIVTLEPAVELHFNADTDVYDTDGQLIGYVKAGSYIEFDGCTEQWATFSSEEVSATPLLIQLEELEKNAVNENLVEEVPNVDETILMEDVTDGNIVLYGGEKYPIKYGGIDEGVGEEINVVLTNVEADIPLFSGDGRLCGHLNKGGNIVVTEYCTVMTAWYRFPNPIEGAEYDYLYLHIYETMMSNDEKELIEEVLQSAGDTIEILDVLDSDMECYEFSILIEEYHKISDYLFNDKLLYWQDNNRWSCNTFFVECTRNGDYFDCKVYYK